MPRRTARSTGRPNFTSSSPSTPCSNRRSHRGSKRSIPTIGRLRWRGSSRRYRTPIVNEYRIIVPDGCERWVGAYGGTTYDAGGRPLRTAGICVDITECKHAEETLREREQQLEFALEGAGAGMWVRDRDGRRIATPQMNALFGRPHDTPPLREEEFPAFIHPDDLPALGEAWLAARENCSKYSQEYRAIWPDGSVHWLASKGRMAADAGDARRFIGITYDITERKRVEKALRETAERYQQALESPLVGFAHCEIVVDRNGAPTDFMYLDVNPTFEAFTRLSWEKVLHRRVTEVLDPSEVADIIRLYGHVAQSSEPTSFEYPIPSLGKWFEVAAFSPQRDQFFAFFTDITRRKRAEGALRKSEARQALLAEVAGRLLVVEEPQGVVDDLCRRALAFPDCDVFFNYLADEASGGLVLNAYGDIPPRRPGGSAGSTSARPSAAAPRATAAGSWSRRSPTTPTRERTLWPGTASGRTPVTLSSLLAGQSVPSRSAPATATATASLTTSSRRCGRSPT